MDNQIQDQDLIPIDVDPRPGMAPEALEAARQEMAELLIEALEECMPDGSWVPGKGIVGLEDDLDALAAGA